MTKGKDVRHRLFILHQQFGVSMEELHLNNSLCFQFVHQYLP